MRRDERPVVENSEVVSGGVLVGEGELVASGRLDAGGSVDDGWGLVVEGGWEVVDGGLEADVVELGGRAVSEVLPGVLVDDIGGGVGEGEVVGRTGGEDDGAEFGKEVEDGTTEEVRDICDDDCGGGSLLVDVGGGLKREEDNEDM
jgi:hypothetical protein